MKVQRSLFVAAFATLLVPMNLPGIASLSDANEVGPLIVFGNSIAEGFIEGVVDTAGRYSTLLRDDLRQREIGTEVVNAGRGGNTSRDGYLRLDEDVLRHEPRIVTVSFGPNDYRLGEGGEFAVEVNEFGLYLRAIVDRIAASGATPILLTLVPVISERFYATHDRALYEDLGGVDAVREIYDRAVRDVAAETGTVLVDLQTAFGDSAVDLMGSDGGHPNERGHRVIANALLPGVLGGLGEGGEERGGETGIGNGIRSLTLYPNPFRTGSGHLVRIDFEAAEAGKVSVEIHRLSGGRVAAPVREIFRLPGRNIEFWDGTGTDGRLLPPGVYLVRLSWRSVTGRSAYRLAKLAILR
jgi:lysophospholipase L1-like esterase